MYLNKLILSNFKNYFQAEFDFSEKINCFIGDNGAGKTNVLDAVYYLSFCKSYFNVIDSQNIKHDQDFFAIHGNYNRNGTKKDIVSCIQKRNARKLFKKNKKEYERLADHIGLFPLVMISPYDRDLINEGSDARRKYIDGVIAQFDRFYLDDLLNYNKALAQRNALLKKMAESGNFDLQSIEIWNAPIVKYGQNIYVKRQQFLTDFIPIFQQYFEFISGGKEKVSIVYQSQLHEESLIDLLESRLDRDRMLKHTSVGVHKDDLDFRIESHPVKKFGSQGQQKSFVIAIKLAQFDFTKNVMGFKPILLFDDIFDKLDDNRVGQIINLVSDNSFGQVFITDTQRIRIEKLFEKAHIDHKIYEIKSGEAFEIKNNNI
jgi:DNA replication and repair protein RecF